MKTARIELSVPAEAVFARSVRMMAANLAVCIDMNVDDVEEVRMAAEEGFVLSCATKPGICAIGFTLSDQGIAMDFSLGTALEDTGELELARLLLSAVCDEFAIDRASAKLHLMKRVS
ncbi:ATP-binding protein [Coriobacteriales bacterium OH1046]|nr:ATP-binding protein [Coriobacteriales bacterium OH1046]